MVTINFSNTKIVSIVSCIILLVGMIVFIIWSPSDSNQFLPSTKVGIPSVYEEYSIGRMSGINQILEYNNTLYLLNDADGTIRIYDLEGNYIGTIAFHITSMNGSFQQSANGDFLYVIDRSSNVYIFKNGEFTEFATRENASDIRRQYDFASTSSHYVAFFGSVWRKTANGLVCIIPKAYTPLNYVYAILLLAIVPIIVFQLVKNGDKGIVFYPLVAAS